MRDSALCLLRAPIALNPRKPSSQRRGFALLVTIVLVSFLVLILVGLATLTRVETQVAANSQQLSQARQNALLALNIALGQLQKYAGPDQRITTRAEVLDTTPATPAVDGVTQPLWTGVWGNENTAASSTNSTILLNWLVSGNEAATFAQNTASGQITTAGTGITYSATTSALTTTGTNPTAVKLIGASTAGSTASNHVIAPLVPITIKAGSLPGFDSSDNTPINIGRYAYWVGDEGVKARVNIKDPTFGSTDYDIVSSKASSVANAPLQAMTGLTGAPSNVVTNDKAGKVISEKQLTFVDSALTDSVVSARFHDLTTYSVGLLTNTKDGGFKKDLSRLLYDTPAPMAASTRIFTDANGAGPSWDIVRSWANLKTNTLSSGFPVAPVVQAHRDLGYTSFGANPQHGVGPVLLRAGAQFLTRTVGASRELGMKPVFVLANPYNVRLPATNYRISFCQSMDGGLGGGYRIQGTPPTSVTTWTSLIPPGVATLGGSADRPWLHFITGNVSFEPGEAKVFSYTGNWSNIVEFNQLQNSLNPNGIVKFLATFPAAGVIEENCTGKNPTAHLAVHTGNSAIGEPLGRIERVGTGNEALNSTLTIDLTLALDSSNFVFGSVSRQPWLADYNLRYNFPVTIAGTADAPTASDPRRERSFYGRRYGTSNWHQPIVPQNTGGNAYWGPDTKPPLGQLYCTLFSLPQNDIISVGQLMHVNLFGFDRFVRAGNRLNVGVDASRKKAGMMQPSYGVGSSFRDPAVASADMDYDMVVRTNRELWDKWFVSSVPTSLSTLDAFSVPNSRMILASDYGAKATTLAAVKDMNSAGAGLMIKGAFNVNSTSIEAWKSILSATLELKSAVALPAASSVSLDPASTGTRLGRTNTVNRSIGDDGLGYDSRWASSVRLQSGDIQVLAEKIVESIKTRWALNSNKSGFFALSDLINRLSGDEAGLLQRALESIASYNSNFITDTQSSSGNSITGYTATADDRLNKAGTGAPFQADLLQAIGPILTTRSDTFRIRAYGEQLNPLVAGESKGKAWCEAIVQRIPDYIDTVSDPAPVIYPPTALANQQQGRRFKIMSFRWLTESETL